MTSEKKIKELPTYSQVVVDVKITYDIYSPKLSGNHFGIYAAKTNLGEKISFKGVFPIEVFVDKYYRITAEVGEPYKGGQQLSLKSYLSVYPFGEEDIRKVLEEECHYKGNPDLLFKCLGEEPLKVIAEDLDLAVRELGAFGVKRKELEEIRTIVVKEDLVEKAYKELLDLGLEEKEAAWLMEHYGLKSPDLIKLDPYSLLSTEMPIKFSSLDRIALENGQRIDDRVRLTEIAKHLVRSLTSPNGHTLCTMEKFWEVYPVMAGYPMGAVEAKRYIAATEAKLLCDAGVTVDLRKGSEIEIAKALGAMGGTGSIGSGTTGITSVGFGATGVSAIGAVSGLVGGSTLPVIIGGTYSIGKNTVDIDGIGVSSFYRKWKGARTRDAFQYPRFLLDLSLLHKIVDGLNSPTKIKAVYMDGTEYYQMEYMNTHEINIGKRLFAIQDTASVQFSEKDLKTAISSSLASMTKRRGSKVELEPEQREAVQTICSSSGGVHILTGPAGSGKTFTMEMIFKTLGSLREKAGLSSLKPVILAPTGQAAQIANKATSAPAETIHRHFGIIGDMVKKKTSASYDLYLIDETSMVDTTVLSLMLDGIPKQSKIVFVGDTEQLPSVGAGSCLRDMIESGCITHSRLLTVKRQASGSGTLINANKIIAGKHIGTELCNPGTLSGNAYHREHSTDKKILADLMAMVKDYGLEGFHNNQFQILCAMKSYGIGTNAINQKVQALLNPYQERVMMSHGKGYDKVATSQYAEDEDGNLVPLCLHVGDKVINTKNNYDVVRFILDSSGSPEVIENNGGLMNGEAAIVTSITKVYESETLLYSMREPEDPDADPSSNMVRRIILEQTVEFGGGTRKEYLEVLGGYIRDLLLAYAITIHKSQGAQWPVVVAPFGSISYNMHYRQLLYTMYTRAQDTCITLGELDTVNYCVDHSRKDYRQTGLAQAIAKAFGKKVDNQGKRGAVISLSDLVISAVASGIAVSSGGCSHLGKVAGGEDLPF